MLIIALAAAASAATAHAGTDAADVVVLVVMSWSWWGPFLKLFSSLNTLAFTLEPLKVLPSTNDQQLPSVTHTHRNASLRGTMHHSHLHIG